MEAEASGLKPPKNREGKEFPQQEQQEQQERHIGPVIPRQQPDVYGPEGSGSSLKRRTVGLASPLALTVSIAKMVGPLLTAASRFLGNAPFIPFPFPLCLLLHPSLPLPTRRSFPSR